MVFTNYGNLKLSIVSFFIYYHVLIYPYILEILIYIIYIYVRAYIFPDMLLVTFTATIIMITKLIYLQNLKPKLYIAIYYLKYTLRQIIALKIIH